MRHRSIEQRTRTERARHWVPIVVLALVACGDDGKISFTKEKDNAVMAELESAWQGDGQNPISLSLCEDREKTDAWNDPGNCQDLHVVRGGDRGIEHTEEEPSGCGMGGCLFTVKTYVLGTIGGGPFDQNVPVKGTVRFGDLYDTDKIFSHPYHLTLVCTDDPPSCERITGLLSKDGTLDLEITMSDTTEPIQLTAQRTGDASCISAGQQ